MGAIATRELAAAVSEAGGLGMISLTGFSTEKVSWDPEKKDTQAEITELRETIT